MSARKAILVGIDGYSFQPLNSAANDVIALRAALLGASGMAPIFEQNDITCLVTPAEDAGAPPGSIPATRDAILKALRSHYDDPEPASFLFVYFAGHGLATSPDGRIRHTVFLPSDVPDPEEGRNMICLEDLLALFSERGPLQQLWIMDACRNMSYKKRPRGYTIEWPEQPVQGQRAQTAIYAVAPGGTAISAKGEHGRFTKHLIDGLGGKGCAADYIAGTGHCVTAESLHCYVQRRIKAELEDFDEWTRFFQMPQISHVGSPLMPLRSIPPPPPREFKVEVRPTEAKEAVALALEVQLGVPVSTWPSVAAPRVYELRATLRNGMKANGWGEPIPALRAVDLREEDKAFIDVPLLQQPSPALGPTTGESGISEAATVNRSRARFFAPISTDTPALLTVLAADFGAHVRAKRAEPPWQETVAEPNKPFSAKAGVWDIAVQLGNETISATRVVLGPGEERTIEATAQITPATAALFAEAAIPQPTSSRAVSVTPSERIGPIQGAILPTLLPLLALKPFDRNRLLLHQFSLPDVPIYAVHSASPLSLAVAIDGNGRRSDPVEVAAASLRWVGAEGRITVLARDFRDPRDTLSVRAAGKVFNIAAPSISNVVTAISLTCWPDGRCDASVGLYRLPLGRSWDPNRTNDEIAQIVRAQALGARFLGSPTDLKSGSSLLQDVSYAKWIDPVLGALAFYEHDSRLAAAKKGRDQTAFDQLWQWREEIRSNMSRYLSDLPDSRIIAALDSDETVRRDALHKLLSDDTLNQPVLTASLAHLAQAAEEARLVDHWAIDRLDQVLHDQIFNIVEIA